MRLETVKNDLREHEGFRSHAYQDHLGYWTIGYGRLVDERKGGGITIPEAEIMLENDILKKEQQLKNELHYWDRLPHQVQRVLINMCFQLGLSGLMKFKKMLSAIQQGQYSQAAEEGLDSLWARQTPVRAIQVMDWLRHATDT